MSPPHEDAPQAPGSPGDPGSGGPDGSGVAQEAQDEAVAAAQQEARRRADGGRPVNRFFERLLNALGGGGSVSAVFGAPVERTGVTVIPVARVRLVLGGGLGVDAELGEGGGGGGLVSAVPVGYIEVRDQDAAYRPIQRTLADTLRPVALVLAAGLARALVRAARRR